MNQRNGRIAFLLVAILNLPVMVAAQSSGVGIFGDFSLNMHSANFQGLPGIPSCCPQYGSGSGSGVAFGVLYKIPFTQNSGLQLRADYQSQNALLSSTVPVDVFFNDVLTRGAFDYRIDSKISSAGIAPMFDSRIFANLHLLLGARIGFVTTKTYGQSEVISSPANGGTFADTAGNDTHSRTRNASTGTIPDASAIQLAATVGVQYPFPINQEHTLMLAPEAMYQYALTDVAKGVSWKAHALRVGVALMMNPKSVLEEYKREEKIDTVRWPSPAVTRDSFVVGVTIRSSDVTERDGVRRTTETSRRTDTLFLPVQRRDEQKTNINVEVAAWSVTKVGNETKLEKLTLEEFYSTFMVPLLHYIFFDEDSTAIPGRYNRLDPRSVATFNIDAVNSPAKLPTYHHLLNIVGRRMLDHPNSKVTLIGCNQDIRNEKGNLTLSRQRAEAVKRYLTDVWSIPSKRITIQVRNLPERAANTTTVDGAEENRRVEIVTDDDDLLAPVVTSDTLHDASVQIVRFRTKLLLEAGGASWSLRVSQGRTLIKEFRGTGTPPHDIEWNVTEERESWPNMHGELVYHLSVTDNRGAEAHDEHVLPAEQLTIRRKRTERLGDKEIDRFSLILFDVRSSEITRSNKHIIDLIRPFLKPTSSVTITGYTDRLGDPTYNQQLSERRSESTRRELHFDKAVVNGAGQASLYDSTVPEGRLYTRTVEIHAETPIEN